MTTEQMIEEALKEFDEKFNQEKLNVCTIKVAPKDVKTFFREQLNLIATKSAEEEREKFVGDGSKEWFSFKLFNKLYDLFLEADKYGMVTMPDVFRIMVEVDKNSQPKMYRNPSQTKPTERGRMNRGQDFAITTRTDPELVIDWAKEEIQEWAEVIAANPQEEVSEFAVEQIKQYQKLIEIMSNYTKP